MNLPPMKALTLWQPWATLLAHGRKRIETRSWRPRYVREPFYLAVHASSYWSKALHGMTCQEPFRSELAQCGVRVVDQMSMSAVVGVVRVLQCVQTVEIAEGGRFAGLLTEKEGKFGDYTPGRWGWVCDQFLPFPEPVPCKGQRFLWEWKPLEGLAALERLRQFLRTDGRSVIGSNN